jgi:hypothetical protein
MGKRLPAYQSHQARGLRRVTLLVPEACAMGLSSGRGPDVALLRRQPHGSLLTRRRRKADSNCWSHFDGDALRNTFFVSCTPSEGRSARPRGETDGFESPSLPAASQANFELILAGMRHRDLRPMASSRRQRGPG